MSMNRDLGFELSEVSKIIVMDAAGQVEQSLAKKFKFRAIEMAKQGIFGSLKTRKASLQKSYSQLASLVDNFSVPVLLYGEPGSGKRRLIEEFLTLQNFFQRLQGKELGLLKVLKADLQVEGYTSQMMAPNLNDLIYIENVDALSMPCQEELLLLLNIRKKLAEAGVAVPRLIVGTEKALSIMVIRQEFSRSLFQGLTASTVFLPSLHERHEDFVHILQSVIEDLDGTMNPPLPAVVDAMSRYLWPDNFDELKRVVKTLLQNKNEVSSWGLEDLPVSIVPRPAIKAKLAVAQRFKMSQPEDISEASNERSRIKDELEKASGNRAMAALNMGISRQQLLQKLMTYGLR